MRTIALTAFSVLALAMPAAVRAQDPGALPADLARRVTEILNDDQTRRYEGHAAIESGDVVEGDVAVLDGNLALGGRVEGDVVVVNGSLELSEGAEVTGDILVVGGDIAQPEAAEVGGDMIVFAEPVSHCRRGDAVDVTGDCSGLASAGGMDAGLTLGADDAWETADGRERATARFVVAAGRSYNRVEGLPITFGPAVETAGENPLRVRALAVFRTEQDGGLDSDRWGWDARVEQFLGGKRAFRLGLRAFSVVDPIEAGHLTDMENSLSTFFLHQDFRDHYHRRGFTAYATLAPRWSPFSVSAEYREERHRSMAPGSPWALYNNDEPWRPQPLVGEGRLSSVAGIVAVDSRSEERDPASGWYVRGEMEKALRSSLTRPDANADVAFVLPPEPFDGRWLAGTLDIRRYNRISPSSRLNLRLAGGASINGEALPPQRQHALGGEGTLPGYPLFALDCGARATSVSRGDGTDDNFFPRYGCESFALLQAEYRGNVSFHLNLGRGGDDDDDADEDAGWSEWRSIDADLGWVFFADAGRGWRGGHNEATAVDVGAGILVGDLGIYFAVPVADDRERGPVNFFIRLAPRF